MAGLVHVEADVARYPLPGAVEVSVEVVLGRYDYVGGIVVCLAAIAGSGRIADIDSSDLGLHPFVQGARRPREMP
jgi:hypothetical protein